MNVERLTALAEWLEAGGKPNGVKATFRMSTWFTPHAFDCGTACCIAGSAVLKFGTADECSKLYNGRLSPNWIPNAAKEVLGLDAVQATRLFVPSFLDLGKIDAAWAARTIRHLIDTGKVDWAITKRQESNAEESASQD